MESTYADDRRRNRLQGMLLTVNGDSIMETQLYSMGFRKLFLNVKHVDDTPIRREIQQYLGSRPTCYRYMNGPLTLTPGQQAGIISIFRSYGYTEELNFDNYIDRYAYKQN